MHIFLVNDDGIGSIGIMALLDAACARGHQVTMCAPSGPQSAASHRITLTEPLYLKEYPVQQKNAKAYAITGTPADCVRIGLGGGILDNPVDLVLSGINNGYNAGMAVHYSGTVGAAMEGALNHLPSIAASIDYDADPQNVAQLAEYVLELAEGYQSKALPGSILNVNAPNLPRCAWEKPVYTPLSEANFTDGYDRCYAERVGTYYWMQSGCATEAYQEGTDLWYLNQNHVTLTLMGNPVTLPENLFQAMGLN
ncbi:MAG: 5'/3'-nucleotidase SurE [Eubacteriales bacterium]|nr:5'/3'-nucleotidase SurE [Eubacteriales bacterium]